MEIQKLYRPYTPSRQDPSFLERTSTGHEDLLSDLFVSIEDQVRKTTHQHWLLIGPRGIGKSHIIALLQNRVKSNPILYKRWLPIWFPEEAAGIITLRDFMEKVMKLSRDELIKEGSSDNGRRFDELLEATHGEVNDRKAINRIRAFLLDWKEENHRKILVLLENADRVLGNRIAKKLPDEKWLRDLLMNKDLFLLIATSPTFFKQVVNKDRPLYELFRIEVIDDLSFDESLDLLIKYAKEERRADLVKAFKTKSNRIKAIHALTGGNPRLLVMLYILIQDSVSNISDVEVAFFNLLEELTPYFQSRMAQLKAQEEKILVAFAEGPELLTPAEVGRKIRMATNLVTANLKRLQSAGFIKRIEKPVKGRKGTLYRLSETIYRYWYQMNSERNREMAEIFVRFIVLYYTYSEIRQIYIATSGSTKPVADKGVSGSVKDASREMKYVEAAMVLAKTAESQRFWKLVAKAKEERRSIDEIKKIYQEMIEIDRENLDVLNDYGIYLCTTGELEAGIIYFGKMLALAEKAKERGYQGGAYYNWGNALSDLARLKGDEGFFRESFEKYALAVKYKKDKHEAYYNWGNALSDLASLKGDEGFFRESFEKYALAVKYKKDNHEAYNNWGIALSDLASLKGDEGFFRESFEKYALAWDLIKVLKQLDHTLMVNTALKMVLTAHLVGKGDEADHTFTELVGALSKVVQLKAAIPYFFGFFKSMAGQGKTSIAGRYLEQLLNTKFRKELDPLLPLRFLFKYLEQKDESVIRRQPPEIQKILKEMISEIEEGK